MLPLQILLVNLLSDFPMIAIATDNVDADELKKPREYQVREIVLLATILGLISAVFDFIFFGLFYRISPQVLQTNWFMARFELISFLPGPKGLPVLCSGFRRRLSARQ
ncbi:MAG: Cation-transporting P-type ATPase [Candidatus Azambacteria bacterium GW2011_GWD2_46_48]|uniref:Cation-transporting P-type ATPase n=1 Tax=Candidatus Azambacteria bacterium GW2011_GWD2_46_48 TaxID=1618623 RepID=A0A0G1QAV7_9BACT|nr:MAG: Cation-transporting P-type ATPase [Candidatus Azambacteria bacterium GW2011_GWD2_46_48]